MEAIFTGSKSFTSKPADGLDFFISAIIDIFFSKVRFFKILLKLEEFWINVNKPNDSNSPHTHHDITPPLTDPGISGVFYINIPEGDAGDILLGHERVQPYENLLILFHSDMIHMVYPNRTEKHRISLSFNYV